MFRPEDMPFWFVILGALIGAALGALLFWPNIFGEALSLKEMERLHKSDFEAFVQPSLIKGAVTTVLGAIGGYLFSKRSSGSSGE